MTEERAELLERLQADFSEDEVEILKMMGISLDELVELELHGLVPQIDKKEE